jgi:NADH-quinone oxidoreductase subunit J
VGAAAGALPLAEQPESRSYHSLASAAVLGEALLGFEKTAPDSPVTGVRNIVTAAPGGTSTQETIVKERTKMAYLLPFEIVSLHLLVVLIGAAYLARSKRRRGATS